MIMRTGTDTKINGPPLDHMSPWLATYRLRPKICSSWYWKWSSSQGPHVDVIWKLHKYSKEAIMMALRITSEGDFDGAKLSNKANPHDEMESTSYIKFPLWRTYQVRVSLQARLEKTATLRNKDDLSHLFWRLLSCPKLTCLTRKFRKLYLCHSTWRDGDLSRPHRQNHTGCKDTSQPSERWDTLLLVPAYWRWSLVLSLQS